MNRSMPGLPAHHQLQESTQTHVHWVSDAMQPSHSLSSPFPPAFNLSQHQALFKWVSSLHQVAKVIQSMFFDYSQISLKINNKMITFRNFPGGTMVNFPGGTMVKTLYSQCRGHQFGLWLGELRSLRPHGMAKKKRWLLNNPQLFGN